MNVLALDTSTEYCSVALWRDGEVLSRDTLAGQRHSALVLAMVDEVLAEAGESLGGLDGIAFGSGPGSFTGLRIACGVAQGLALGAERPVAGISTLLALAAGSGAACVVACLDARMGEIYHAAYRHEGGGWEEASPPALMKPDEAPTLPGVGWTGCGSGFDAFGPVLAARYGDALAAVLPGRRPEARHIAALAARRFEAGLGDDPALALPLYLRDKVALKTEERQ